MVAVKQCASPVKRPSSVGAVDIFDFPTHLKVEQYCSDGAKKIVDDDTNDIQKTPKTPRRRSSVVDSPTTVKIRRTQAQSMLRDIDDGMCTKKRLQMRKQYTVDLKKSDTMKVNGRHLKRLKKRSRCTPSVGEAPKQRAAHSADMPKRRHAPLDDRPSTSHGERQQDRRPIAQGSTSRLFAAVLPHSVTPLAGVDRLPRRRLAAVDPNSPPLTDSPLSPFTRVKEMQHSPMTPSTSSYHRTSYMSNEASVIKALKASQQLQEKQKLRDNTRDYDEPSSEDEDSFVVDH